MEYIFLLIFGICITVLGIFNLKGNISSIHWYNRLKITEENRKKYGKSMGIGSLIIGICMTITAILQMIFYNENIWYITVIGIVIGLIFMIYGQIKYNRGIF
jgi:hypothetical protein